MQQLIWRFAWLTIFCSVMFSLAQDNPLSSPDKPANPLAPADSSTPTATITSWSADGWGGNYWANSCEGDTNTEAWLSLFLQSYGENEIRGYLGNQSTQIELILSFETGSRFATGTGTTLDENGMPSNAAPATVTLELRFPLVALTSEDTTIYFGAQGYTYFTSQAEGCKLTIDTSYQPNLSTDVELEEGEEDEEYEEEE